MKVGGEYSYPFNGTEFRPFRVEEIDARKGFAYVTWLDTNTRGGVKLDSPKVRSALPSPDLIAAIVRSQDAVFANTLNRGQNGTDSQYFCEECHRLWAEAGALCAAHKRAGAEQRT